MSKLHRSISAYLSAYQSTDTAAYLAFAKTTTTATATAAKHSPATSTQPDIPIYSTTSTPSYLQPLYLHHEPNTTPPATRNSRTTHIRQTTIHCTRSSTAVTIATTKLLTGQRTRQQRHTIDSYDQSILRCTFPPCLSASSGHDMQSMCGVEMVVRRWILCA